MFLGSVLTRHMPLENLRELISGAYELEEWHVEGAVLRPPQVEGRFLFASLASYHREVIGRARLERFSRAYLGGEHTRSRISLRVPEIRRAFGRRPASPKRNSRLFVRATN